jgi:Ras-related protein Rab-6A
LVFRQVSTEEGEEKARELHVLFLEASAKAGKNKETMERKRREQIDTTA